MIFLLFFEIYLYQNNPKNITNQKQILLYIFWTLTWLNPSYMMGQPAIYMRFNQYLK